MDQEANLLVEGLLRDSEKNSQDNTKSPQSSGTSPLLTLPNPRIDSACMPARHKAMKFADATGDEWKAMFESAKVLIGNGAMVVLLGTRGSGKTQLGCMLLRYAAIKMDKSVLYTKAMNVFMEIKGSYSDKDMSEKQVVSNFCKPQVLLIDALEEKSESAWENRILSHIIDMRYDAKKDTILISNDSKSKFAESSGASIVDRVFETGNVFECNWDSFRRK